MLRSCILIVLTLILSTCNNDDSIPPVILESTVCNDIDFNFRLAYIEDAKDLYMAEIVQDSTHPNYDKIILDSLEIERILCLLNKVNQSNSIYRDTVFDIYNIHSRYFFDYNAMLVEVDTSFPEIRNLSNGTIPTGAPNLDSLLKKYEFDSVLVGIFNSLVLFTNNEFI